MSFVLKQLKNNRLKIERNVIEDPGSIDYKWIGGKINNKTLKHMINNGYMDNPAIMDNIDGYILDKELSGKRAQVYYHPEKDHLVVNHRGTKGIHDVMTDIRLVLGDKSGNRFKHGKKITDDALRKYNTENVTIAGHSLAGEIARQSSKNDNHDIIVVNPAVAPLDMFNRQKDNETVIRSTLDPVSGLHGFNPFANETKTIDIPFQSYNPLEEHHAEILDRLGDIEIGT